jgi:hypothetical protein
MKPIPRFNRAPRRWIRLARRLACASALAVGTAATLADGAAPVATDAPRFSAPAAAHDFGRVRGGEVARHKFLFTNTGAGTLELKLVKSSCGCLTVGDYPQRVEPGQKGEVPVELQTVTYSGSVAETITFKSNDSAQPSVAFHVKASVWWPVEISPRSAVFDVIPGNPTDASAIVRITNHLSEALNLSTPVSSLPWLVTELVTNQPGRDFTLTIKATPPPNSGNLFGRVTVKTSSDQFPLIEIPVYGLLRPAVTIMPPRMVLSGATLTNPQSQSVSIRNASTNALKLSAPRANVVGVEVSLREVEAGQLYTLTATFPSGFTAKPEQRLELGVRSNHPQLPEIRVPVVVLTNAAILGEK